MVDSLTALFTPALLTLLKQFGFGAPAVMLVMQAAPAVQAAVSQALRTWVQTAAGAVAVTYADMIELAAYLLFAYALLGPVACRVTHSYWPATAKVLGLQISKARRPPPLHRRLLLACWHLCCALCVLAAIVCARAVAELMSAGEADSTIVRLRSWFATAAPGTAPLHEERTETRVQRGIGLCAQLAGACDHTVASQPVVSRLLYCVHDILSKSTPAYPGSACSAEVAMQQVDLDHDGALNATERDRALQIFVPGGFYDPDLLGFIAC